MKDTRKKKYTDEHLYAWYLKYKLLGQPLYKLADQMKCHIRFIHLVRNRVESTHEYPQSSNIRAAKWKNTYALLWKYFGDAERMRIAIMEDMYYKSGFGVSEIAELTGLNPKNVENTLFH